MKETQLTNTPDGHMLNTTQVFSKDGKWLVYDTRNDDSKIASTGVIAQVNVESGEVVVLYRTENQTAFGPGVGAATFSPVANRVIFIQGIKNSDQKNPYSFTRRTGVAVDTDTPGKAIFMDARDITEPFTPGALRGGTHAHSWSGDGQWLSFTYNDYVIEQWSKIHPGVSDLRTVGVMFPREVFVAEDGTAENNSGKMFSVIVAGVTEHPQAGSDEINKAFDECWIGKKGYQKEDGKWQEKAIAFQGNVRDDTGQIKTEIFVVNLPTDLNRILPDRILAGTNKHRPGVPNELVQRRITFTKAGIQGPRHWLRSSPDGAQIAFLSKDQHGFINVFVVSPNGGAVKQASFHQFDIQSGFNFSPDGKQLAYVARNSVYITDVTSGKSVQLTESSPEESRPVGCVNWSADGKTLAYNRYVKKDGNYLQIFLLKI